MIILANSSTDLVHSPANRVNNSPHLIPGKLYGIYYNKINSLFECEMFLSLKDGNDFKSLNYQIKVKIPNLAIYLESYEISHYFMYKILIDNKIGWIPSYLVKLVELAE